MSSISKKTKWNYYFNEAYNESVYAPEDKKPDGRKGRVFKTHPWRDKAEIKTEYKKAKGNKTV